MYSVYFIGRPNVGKSSLFNALLGYRRAIVLDEPGTTVDEVREIVQWDNTSLALIDSQGIFSEGDEAFLRGVIKKANALVFVVDGQTGPTPFDRWIASMVRSSRKPVLFCVNKCDDDENSRWQEFTDLGLGHGVEVSAAHRRNMGEIREWIIRTAGERTEGIGAPVLKLAMIGRPNTGKSTLMNTLCRENISRVSPKPHTTRDPIACEIPHPLGLIRLVDTAGVRRPRSEKQAVEMFSIQASLRAISQADVIFLLIASHEPVSDQDMRLLGLIAREGKPTAILLNFWDQLPAKARRHFFEDSEFGDYLKQFKTVPISGLTGFNVDQCLPLAFSLQKQAKKRVKTSRLNQVVERIVAKNPPPSMGRHNFNILYASQVRTEPPTFVFFMNRKGSLPPSYRKYIENGLRKALGYKSQPIRLFFRGDKEAR